MLSEEMLVKKLLACLKRERPEGHEKVWLSIRGNMGSEDVVGGTEYNTEGEYYLEQNVHCISYNESVMAGMGNTNTTVKMAGNQVSVIRLGDINSLMEFQAGKHSSSFYETPYGDLMMQIYTKAANVDFDENQTPRKVSVEYDLTLGSQKSDTHRLQIEIRPESVKNNAECTMHNA